MSRERPTIYQDHGSVYEADACIPFERAMRSGQIQATAWARGKYPGVRLKSNLLQGISSIGCWDISRDQDWYIQPHYNEGIEITMVLNGSISLEFNGQSEMLTRGRIALTSPWQKHTFGKPYVSASRIVYLILDVGVRRPNSPWNWPSWILATEKEKVRMAGNIVHNKFPVFSARSETAWAMEHIFDLLMNSTAEESASTMEIYINLAFNSLSATLESHTQTELQLSDKHLTVRLFLQGIQEHIGHNWRLEEMADQCGMSRSQFSSICKELTNKSPIEYLNDLRLTSAAEALVNPDGHSITDICFDNGFGSSQYFSRRFSERFGMSPRQFRSVNATATSNSGIVDHMSIAE